MPSADGCGSSLRTSLLALFQPRAAEQRPRHGHVPGHVLRKDRDGVVLATELRLGEQVADGATLELAPGMRMIFVMMFLVSAPAVVLSTHGVVVIITLTSCSITSTFTFISSFILRIFMFIPDVQQLMRIAHAAVLLFRLQLHVRISELIDKLGVALQLVQPARTLGAAQHHRLVCSNVVTPERLRRENIAALNVLIRIFP